MNSEGNAEHNDSIDISGLDPVENIACSMCKNPILTAGFKPFTMAKCPSCGAENLVPGKFGHFHLLKRLGAGGMGTVFLAQDITLGRKVAIKMMQKSLAEDAASFETFRNEAQSAAKLNHPHVAQVYSFGQQKGSPYLEMELVPGSKLDGFISNGVQLDPAFVMRVGLEIAEGLRAAEGVGLFHGDIKPDNILFDTNMHAKLVDFGIASMASQGKSNELWGTPYYIAPEKVQKKKNSARSDIYSLGATLYHAIAGEPPYEGDDAIAVIKARFQGPPKPLEEIRPEIESEVTRIIGRMMYNDLFMRYPNYGSLINDIKNYLASVPAIRKQGPLNTQSVSTRGFVTGALATGDAGGTEASNAKPGKKLVIQKGSMEAQAAFAAVQSAKSVRVTRTSDQTSGAGGGGSSVNGAKVALIAVGAFVLLGVVGVSWWVGSALLKNSRTKKLTVAKSAEAAAIETKYYTLQDEIGSTLNRMVARDVEMTNLVASLDALFLKATGENLVVPDFEPPPPPASEIPAVLIEASPAAGATPGVATPEVGQAPAPKQAPKLPSLDPEMEILARIELKKLGEETPSREMLELMIKKLKKDATEQAPAPEAVPAFAPEPDPEPEAEPEPEPLVEPDAVMPDAPGSNRAGINKLQADSEKLVFEPAKQIRAALRRCEAISYEAPEVFNEVKQGMSPVQINDALAKRTAAYEKRVKYLEEMHALISSSDEALKSIKRSIILIEREAQKLIAERDRLAAEAAAVEAQARLEADLVAKQARANAVASDEVDRVRAVLASKKELIDAFDYGRVILEMQRMEKELTTPEAREELKWVVTRFTRLADLRKFLIDDLKKNGMLRRSYSTQGLDIRGVSDDGFELIVPMRKDITIKSLKVADWLRLIEASLRSRPHDRPIGLVEWGDQLFNAAIFCYVHGGGNEAAISMAKMLAAQAMEKKTSLKLDAVQLIPILAKEAGASETSF